jgi:hypothetical protein
MIRSIKIMDGFSNTCSISVVCKIHFSMLLWYTLGDKNELRKQSARQHSTGLVTVVLPLERWARCVPSMKKSGPETQHKCAHVPNN